tara:strand:+ start:502 stop:888 length:387 start_codon:yes stop_codon:yes gene_type:complete
LNYARKAKVFSRLALKEKMLLLQKIKSLKTVTNEINNMSALSKKLKKLLSEEIKKGDLKSVSQLKTSKFYSQKIHNELSQISNRKDFLKKEMANIRTSAGKTKIKVNKAQDKSSLYHQLQQIEIERKA